MSELDAGAFVRLPLELLVVLVLAVLLPAAPRRVLAVVAGAVLALLMVVKVLDMGFITAFDRPFDPISDSTYVGIGVETLRDAIGRSSANLAVAVIVVLLVGLLALPVLALLRVTRVAAGHRDWVLRGAVVLGVVWVALRLVGAPVASTSAAALAVDEVQTVQSGLAAQRILAREIPRDRFALHAGRPAADRPARQGRPAPVRRELRAGRGAGLVLLARGRTPCSTGAPRSCDARGFSSRSAFLSSSTFGGLSWLAHATLQSGIRIGTQRGYNQLVKSDRVTLSRAFGRAGWRTVVEDPANKRTWPEGKSFYGYDKVYDRRNVGYRGPGFGLPPMPDQYVLQALHDLELARRDRPPLFAEVDLISSHAPWTQIPRLIPWEDVGDGSIFHRVPEEESTEASLFGDAKRARAAYGHSIEYTMSTIISFVQRYADDKTVVVLLGDHQPATLVSGQDASHDVPISVIARDPKVIERIAGWDWQDGPAPEPRGAGVADERVPRPVPHRVRLASSNRGDSA